MNETANFLCATNAPTTDSASDNCGSPGKCPGSPCRLQNANLLGQPFSPVPRRDATTARARRFVALHRNTRRSRRSHRDTSDDSSSICNASFRRLELRTRSTVVCRRLRQRDVIVVIHFPRGRAFAPFADEQHERLQQTLHDPVPYGVVRHRVRHEQRRECARAVRLQP